MPNAGFVRVALTTARTAILNDTLVALERQSWDALKRRDGDFYKRLLSADHVEIGSSGVANKSDVYREGHWLNVAYQQTPETRR
jgi:hypothetical protein